MRLMDGIQPEHPPIPENALPAGEETLFISAAKINHIPNR